MIEDIKKKEVDIRDINLYIEMIEKLKIQGFGWSELDRFICNIGNYKENGKSIITPEIFKKLGEIAKTGLKKLK